MKFLPDVAEKIQIQNI